MFTTLKLSQNMNERMNDTGFSSRKTVRPLNYEFSPTKLETFK